MIENEVIIGSGYHVNPKVLGYASSAYIGVKLEKVQCTGTWYRVREDTGGDRMSFHHGCLHDDHQDLRPRQ